VFIRGCSVPTAFLQVHGAGAKAKAEVKSFQKPDGSWDWRMGTDDWEPEKAVGTTKDTKSTTGEGRGELGVVSGRVRWPGAALARFGSLFSSLLCLSWFASTTVSDGEWCSWEERMELRNHGLTWINLDENRLMLKH
jgi:hypothetical protein